MDSSTPIADWLAKLSLAQYAETFAANKIGFDLLADLTNEDLRELGVGALGDRKRLLAEIAKMRAAPTEPVPAIPVPRSTPVPISAPVPILAGATVPAEALPESPDASSVGREGPSRSSNASKPPAPARPTAEAAKSAPLAGDSRPLSRRGFWARLLAGKFLVVSIAAHLVFGLAATYFIVQRVQARRKVTFQGGPPAVTASKRALEHKVSLAKKKNTGGSPPQAKRIVSGGIAKVSLPDLPSIPSATNSVPGMKASMGGAGFGTGMGFGPGTGSSMGGGGARGAGGMTLFGFRGGGTGLIGTFYDLKQTRDRKPTNMAGPPNEGVSINSPQTKHYTETLKQFVNSWNPSVLSKFYRADVQLATTQIFIPTLSAGEAPKAFGVEKDVQPRRWIIHYQGEIVAPRSGRFRFVGNADDVLIVRCNMRNVLDASLQFCRVAPGANESDNVGPGTIGTLSAGKWIEMHAGEVIQLEVIIGECPGGDFSNFLLIEEQGVAHPPGVFPVFQLQQMAVPDGKVVGHQGTILFGSRARTGSLLNLAR